MGKGKRNEKLPLRGIASRYSVGEILTILGVSPQTLEDWDSEGKIDQGLIFPDEDIQRIRSRLKVLGPACNLIKHIDILNRCEGDELFSITKHILNMHRKGCHKKVDGFQFYCEIDKEGKLKFPESISVDVFHK